MPPAILALAASELVYAQPPHSYLQLPGPAVNVSYNAKYDVSTTSVSTLTCASSLAKYTTYGALPQFPYIAGSANVTGASSSLCGQCYILGYAGNFAQIQVVDSATEGFVLSKEGYGWLTMNYTTDPSVTAYILDGPIVCPPAASEY